MREAARYGSLGSLRAMIRLDTDSLHLVVPEPSLQPLKQAMDLFGVQGGIWEKVFDDAWLVSCPLTVQFERLCRGGQAAVLQMLVEQKAQVVGISGGAFKPETDECRRTTAAMTGREVDTQGTGLTSLEPSA